ncbi:hypothetical protein Tco_0848395, partial [Tanacetum coccineum]
DDGGVMVTVGSRWWRWLWRDDGSSGGVMAWGGGGAERGGE